MSAERIPPKGRTGVTIEVRRVPHGTDVIVQLRSLLLSSTFTTRRAMLFAWSALGVELDAQGLDLMQALLHPPELLKSNDDGVDG